MTATLNLSPNLKLPAASPRLGIPATVTPIPTIAGLLFWRCPSHVARLIALVVINAVDRMGWRWLGADVGIEGREVVHPSFADSDSTTAILSIVLSILIGASSLHLLPRVKLWSFAHAVSFIGGRRSLAVQATAGLYPFAEMILPDDRVISAVALAQPSAMPGANTLRLFNYKEPPEPLTD